MNEIWVTIPNYSNYRVSNFGNIKTLNWKNSGKEAIMNPALSDGYYKTVLVDDNKKYNSVRVHRIVCLGFLGENNLEVNHIDGNKKNNKLNNLEYCTHSENIKHAYKIGLERAKLGEENKSSKLKNEDIVEIREYAKINGYLKDRKMLAEKYNVCESTLKDVVSKRRGYWGHI